MIRDRETERKGWCFFPRVLDLVGLPLSDKARKVVLVDGFHTTLQSNPVR